MVGSSGLTIFSETRRGRKEVSNNLLSKPNLDNLDLAQSIFL